MTNLNQFKQAGIQISKQNPDWIVREGPVVIRGLGNTYKTRLAIMLAIETMLTIRKNSDIAQVLTITSWSCLHQDFFKFVAGCVPSGDLVKETVHETIDAFCTHFNFKFRCYNPVTQNQRYDLAFDFDVLNHVILDELEVCDTSPMNRRDLCHGVKQICEMASGVVFAIAPLAFPLKLMHGVSDEEHISNQLKPLMSMADLVLETSNSEFQWVALYRVPGLPLQVDWEYADLDDCREIDIEHITFGGRRPSGVLEPIDLD